MTYKENNIFFKPYINNMEFVHNTLIMPARSGSHLPDKIKATEKKLIFHKKIKITFDATCFF